MGALNPLHCFNNFFVQLLLFLFSQLKRMQVKVKVFIREQGGKLIVMLGVFLWLDTVVFIKLPKTKMAKYFLNDMGCLHVFSLVLFYVYT